MTTVKEVNDIFLEKGLNIRLPYPTNWLVSDIKIVEKKEFANTVKILLALKLIDEEGKETSELYYGESEIKRERRIRSEKLSIEALKGNLLPERESILFSSEEEAKIYLREAFSHLLIDKGYEIVEEGEERKKADIYAYSKQGRRGFFANIRIRMDEELIKASLEMIELRKEYGASHDYGLIIPAFQEQFGILSSDMEFWISNNAEKLSNHRIGVYAVNNKNPNMIYPLTAYPKERELMKYFMRTTKQWSLLQQRRAKVFSSRL